MKRVFSIAWLVALMLAAVTTSNAQQSENWSNLSRALNGVHTADFQFDFSNAYIDNLPAQDFIDSEKDWETGVTKMKVRFLRQFNRQAMLTSSGLTAGDYPESDVIIVIKFIDVCDRGANILAKFIVKRRLDNQILFSRNVHTDKGLVGPIMSLMGDSLEKMGEDIGRQVKRHVK